MNKQFILVLGKAFGTKRVAHRPIINIRQKSIKLLDTFLKILYLINKKAMKMVFFVVFMWQFKNKLSVFPAFYKLPCKCLEIRESDTYYTVL